MPLGLLAGLVFVAATGGVIGLYVLFAGRSRSDLRRAVDHRLLEITGRAAPVGEGEKGSLFRAQAKGPLPAVDRAARHAVRGFDIDRWVEQSGLRLSISGLLLIAVAAGLLPAIIGLQFTHRLSVAALGFLFGASLPFLFVRYKRTKRLGKFEEHFPEALDLMSRAIRAGHAFSAGLKMVADELNEPIGPEFRKAFEEQNYGLSLKESLNNLAERVPLLDVRFFATAVMIQRETGGNLAEILDSLASVVRERFKIRRQVRVHTAHGRFTGYVLLALPAFLAVALSLINPDHMDMLFKDRIGQTMIVIAIVMQVIGWIWIKKVVKIEV